MYEEAYMDLSILTRAGISDIVRAPQCPSLLPQALDIALRHRRCLELNCLPVGRSFYYPNPANDLDLGSGSMIMSGFTQVGQLWEGVNRVQGCLCWGGGGKGLDSALVICSKLLYETGRGSLW